MCWPTACAPIDARSRRLAVDDPTLIELREWSRIAEELSQERSRLANRIRQQLWRYYPQMLLGVPTEARPKMFQRAMGVIFEMILAESGRSSAAEQKQASARVHKTIAALPSTEFPNLTELREAIVAEAVQAGAAKPSPEVAAEYADRLIATLGVK